MSNKGDDFNFEIEHQSNILIKAENKEQRERAIIMIAILTVTFIMTTLSLVFSIKAYNATKKESQTVALEGNTYYQTLVTSYSDSPAIKIEKLTTGYKYGPKTITITNDGDYELKFNLKLVSIVTNLLSTNSLIYTLTGGETDIRRELPLQESTILNEVSLFAGETKSYNFNIQYDGIIDNASLVYNYSATMVVEQSNLKSTLLE